MRNDADRGQTQTKHEWDGTSDGDDRDRPQVADDDASDSKGLTGARISNLSQDRPDLKFASTHVCCAKAKPSVRDMERVKRIVRYRWDAESKVLVPLAAEWRAGSVFRR